MPSRHPKTQRLSSAAFLYPDGVWVKMGVQWGGIVGWETYKAPPPPCVAGYPSPASGGGEGRRCAPLLAGELDAKRTEGGMRAVGMQSKELND